MYAHANVKYAPNYLHREVKMFVSIEAGCKV